MTGMHRMDRLIGHRGLAAEAPENTLEGVRLAAGKGFTWIEIDTLPTADGIPVVSHDDTLKRCFGVDLSIPHTSHSKLTEQASALPQLADLLDLAMELDLGVNIELKQYRDVGTRGVSEVMKVASRHSRERIVVSSFSIDLLRSARREDCNAQLALVTDRLFAGWDRAAHDLQVGNIHLSHNGAEKEERCRAVKNQGYGLYVFTVNDAAAFDMLCGQGVDGVFTDTSLLAGSMRKAP